MTKTEALKTDQWGRPAELAPGTAATYSYTCTVTEEDEPLEETLEYLRREFSAEVAGERNADQYNPDGQEPPEYILTVTVPASHHAAFREYLDDLGWEDEVPVDWPSFREGDLVVKGDRSGRVVEVAGANVTVMWDGTEDMTTVDQFTIRRVVGR